MRTRICTCILLFCLAPRETLASVLALNFSGSPENNNIVNFTVGWQFTVNQTIQVDGLGYFDTGGNGLVAAHDVAIWTSGGSGPLASTTVPNGTGATLINSFRVVPITPTTLVPGSYVIGGHSAGGDLVADMAASVSTISEISFVENRAVSSFSVTFPTTNVPSQGLGFFGPNFTVVPEPGGAALIGGGGMLLGCARRRRVR